MTLDSPNAPATTGHQLWLRLSFPAKHSSVLCWLDQDPRRARRANVWPLPNQRPVDSCSV